MKNFEEYEAIALESKKILFDAYVKEQKLEEEYQKKGGIKASIDVYKWRNSEREKLENEFYKIIVGGTEDNLYETKDSDKIIMIIDFGGNDVYETTKNVKFIIQ